MWKRNQDESGPADGVLVQRLREGERAAFDVLFERYRRPLLAYARGLLHDGGDAEDAVQETFLRFLENLPRIRTRGRVSGWLYRTARNLCIDRLRRRAREQAGGDPQSAAEQALSPVASPDAQLLADERQRTVARAVEMLPPAEREVVRLRYVSELTYREIADALERPLGTVLWQSNRALRRLARTLGDA